MMTAEAKHTPGEWKPTLAEELAERAKRQMLNTEREAFQAAQSGDKARQSIASTESERHRAVYHAMCLIVADQRNEIRTIPVAENCGRYLAEVNDGRLLYLNHANTWQECPNFIRQKKDSHDALVAALESFARAAQGYDTPDENGPWPDIQDVFVTLGDCRRAFAAIAKARGDGNV